MISVDGVFVPMRPTETLEDGAEVENGGYIKYIQIEKIKKQQKELTKNKESISPFCYFCLDRTRTTNPFAPEKAKGSAPIQP